MSELNQDALPVTWEWAKISDITTLVRGVSYKKENARNTECEGYLPILRATNITGNSLTFTDAVYVPKSGVKDDQLLRYGDIVIASSSGSKEIVGKAGQFFNPVWAGSFGAFCTGIRPEPELDSCYIGYYFQSPAYRKSISDISAGSNINNIKTTELAEHLTPIAPKGEQIRIVEKLEELLTDLDTATNELKTAQKKLTQYRQSLLKAAVEGQLTQAWRQHNPIQETGEQLLARILKERRARWEQKQLAKFTEQGKTPPKDWQSKYPEPVQPNVSELPVLPEGWVWASMAQLCEIQGGIQKQPSRTPVLNKYPFLRVANVARSYLKLDEIHEVELFEGELERLVLQKGDVLIVEGNGSLTEIGRCALWDDSIKNAVHQNHLIRARPVLMVSEFMETWLNSFRGIEQMTTLAATTSGLYTLSVGKISKIPVPVPPLSEQMQIYDLLNIAIAEQIRQSSAIEISLKQAAAQRKNILKSAFSGQLVPQNPNDEPASVLLARIKAERAKQEKLPKKRNNQVTVTP